MVLLVGPQGSGKTTYCLTFLPDYLRISQDEQGRQGHFTAYQEALTQGKPFVVVDRINALKCQRKRYLDLARQHGYVTRIIWLNADRNLCLRRCRERTDHPTLHPEDAEKALALYYRGFQIPTRREADSLEVIGPPPEYAPVRDLTAQIGARRHIILGDVHGCLDETLALLDQLRFDWDRDVLISVGDIVDRGPKIRETVEFLFGLPEFYMVLGNHEYKLLRYLQGNNVKITGGLETTIQAYDNRFPPDLTERLAALPLILKTPSGYVVHAGFDPEMPPEEQSSVDCWFMRFYGGKTYFDEINGRVWHSLWPRDWPRVFFGHIPDPDGPTLEHVCSLDAGCVFGGELKAFDSRNGRVHSVKARQPYAVSEFVQAAHVSPTETLRKREEYIVAGLLRGDRTDDGRLAIYTYSDQCVYDSAWDEITRNSRGHIFDLHTGECVAWPFPKFFNLGENQEALQEQFPWDQPYEIYEKMDGWLGVLYRHEDRFKVASRGSFHSSGATWATEFIQGLDFSCLPNDATLCFEIIHPEHQIILNYQGQKTLIVLAAFNRFTGVEYPRTVVAEWARKIGLPLVPLLGQMSLEDLLRTQKDRQQFEGFVLRFADSRRVKVKTEWYLQIAKIMANLTPIAVWEVMHSGKVQEAYLVQVPEELRPLAEKYKAILEGQYARVLLDIEETAAPILAQYGSDRKALAMYVNDRQKELDYRKPAIFLLLDGKRDKLERIIMDRIYPRGNHFVADALPTKE
jgi:RNA ligase